MNIDEEKRELALTFEHTVNIQIYLPIFTPISTIEYLDVNKLAETDQKIEIGRIEGGCCDQRVYAEIKKGMVIGVEVVPCEDSAIEVPVSNGLAAIVAKAYEKMAIPEKWEPIPVTELIAKKDRPWINIGGGSNCIWVCIGDLGCGICCNNPPRCWTTPRGGNLLASPD